ncbi:MAG: patatin-like phospholipase family protein [Prevotella sp.]|nr:patatin-like phospholipase family protein [Prevotella sp.]
MLRTIIIIILTTLSSMMLASDTSDHPKIGLVLGGGGAKGAAEVGVLKVLEEKGIRPDYIAGTSIGAIVGGLYACGYSAADLDTLFRSQEWLSLIGDRKRDLRNNILTEREGVVYLFGFPISGQTKKTEAKESPLGILGGTNITFLLDSLTKRYDGIQSFDSLPIPFRCVAVDLKKQEEVIMDSCELELAMRASISIPGAFKPVKWNGKLLVDGGMLNNLPVDVVRAMGADIVIAVDLEQTQHEERDFSLKETFGIGGILDWAVSRPDWKKNKANREDADIYINPQLAEYGVSSFGKESISTMIERGEKAARAASELLDRLR